MTMQTTLLEWRPDLPRGPDPTFARIVRALERDIDGGKLAPGARLPTHRDLAERLGVGVGTVTRAYAEAELRGLVTATVGKGSFVAPLRSNGEGGQLIDLGRNLPPLGPAEVALRRSFAQLARRADLTDQLDYPPAGGFTAARRSGALWLERTAHLRGLDPERLICCAGAQQAVTVAIAALCRPGEALIAEEATFHGLKLSAAHIGVRLVPAAMDDQGITPESLERAAAQGGARVAYLLPVQNPTARIMGAVRRQEIIEVARRRGLILIEDDLYASSSTDLGLEPLAALAPDRVAYVSGLSKSLAPGLRVGYLIAPDEEIHDRALEALRAVAFGSPALGALVATQWIETGEAFAILDAVRAELEVRTDMARDILGDAIEPIVQRRSSHLWLPMNELEAERVAGHAQRAGVQLTPPQAPFLPGVPVSGLRLCLGVPRDHATLRRGLETVRAALSPRAAGAGNIV